MPGKKSISSQAAAKRHAKKPWIGYTNMELSTNTLKCGGPLTVPMTFCLKCNGVRYWTSNIMFGAFSKTETVLLQPGEKLDIPVCRCEMATFELRSAAEPAHNGGMPSKANEMQVGGTHYKSQMQHWDYVLANDIPYLEAMVIKYLTRWRKKGGHEDIRKAYHFILKLAEVEGCSLETSEATPAYVDQEEKR